MLLKYSDTIEYYVDVLILLTIKIYSIMNYIKQKKEVNTIEVYIEFRVVHLTTGSGL